MTVRAVLIGAAGYATGSIIAGKIENRVPECKDSKHFVVDRHRAY